MANTQVYSLWILLEGTTSPELLDLSFTTADPNLSHLARRLGQILDHLASVYASNFEFFDSDLTKLRRGITLRAIEQNTSDTNPLVVRYPLSEKTGGPFCMHMFFLRSEILSRFPFL